MDLDPVPGLSGSHRTFSFRFREKEKGAAPGVRPVPFVDFPTIHDGSPSGTENETAVLAGIFARKRTRTVVLLCTLDVRQVRRRALGKRKAPGMESNPFSLGTRKAGGQSSLPRRPR
jgi:hypothetical protein